MRMLKLLVIFIIILTSCIKSRKPGFWEVKRQEVFDSIYYSIPILVKHAPKDAKDRMEMMYEYLKNKEHTTDSINHIKKLLSLSFYEYTCNTSYFLNNDEDPGGWSSYILSDYNDQKIGFILAVEEHKKLEIQEKYNMIENVYLLALYNVKLNLSDTITCNRDLLIINAN